MLNDGSQIKTHRLLIFCDLFNGLKKINYRQKLLFYYIFLGNHSLKPFTLAD